MKFIKLITIVLMILVSHLNAQYSNYYTVDVNADINANINKNINVSGNINKTITTIDYGALASANAQYERNRIESMQFQNQLLKQQAIEIANDPFNAYQYSQVHIEKLKDREVLNSLKIDKGEIRIAIMHPTLFTQIQGTEGWITYQNRSSKDVLTEIIFFAPFSTELAPQYSSIEGLEKMLKYEDITEGQETDKLSSGAKSFLHKKDIKRATVWGKQGFKGTLVWEDQYEKAITDNYFTVYDGVVYGVKVRYKGDTSVVNFEELEGRRFYFSRLIEQYIATPNYTYKKK